MPTIAVAGAGNPPSSPAFRFATKVVLATENGAVPWVALEIICLVKISVPVNVRLAAVLNGRTAVKSCPVTPVAVIEYTCLVCVLLAAVSLQTSVNQFVIVHFRMA